MKCIHVINVIDGCICGVIFQYTFSTMLYRCYCAKVFCFMGAKISIIKHIAEPYNRIFFCTCRSDDHLLSCKKPAVYAADFSFQTVADYSLRSSPPFHVMGPSIHRTSPLDNIRRIGHIQSTDSICFFGSSISNVCLSDGFVIPRPLDSRGPLPAPMKSAPLAKIMPFGNTGAHKCSRENTQLSSGFRGISSPHSS